MSAASASPSRAPTARVHVPSTRDLGLLAPGIAQQARTVLELMRADGHDPIVFETLRTRERVWYLFGKGRTAAQCRVASVPETYAWPDCPDGIVTKANRLEDTVHAYGLAFDVISASRRWGAPAAFWSSLERACQQVGLFWAGRWPTLPDRPHCQVGQWTRGPSVWAREQLRLGSLHNVWTRLGVA